MHYDKQALIICASKRKHTIYTAAATAVKPKFGKKIKSPEKDSILMSHAQVKRVYKHGDKMTLCFVAKDLDVSVVQTGKLEPKIRNQLEQLLQKYKHMFPDKLEPDRQVRPGMPEEYTTYTGCGGPE